MAAPRVMVVDDNLVVRSGLISLLEAEGIEVIGQAGDGRTAIDLAERLRPDLVLLDVQMPLLDGVTAAATLSRFTRVIILTYTEDADVVNRAIANGACGYLVHGSFTAEELTAAVHTAIGGAHPLSPQAVAALVGAVRLETAATQAGGPPAEASHEALVEEQRSFGLSAREAEVMDLIARGHTNGEIATRLFLAEKTVKNHVNRVYAKLGVTSRAAAIARWLGTAEGR